MSPKIKNMMIRTISGAVYVALMVVGVLYPPVMGVLMAVVACLAIHEFHKLASGPADYLSELLMDVIAVASCIVILSSTFRGSGFSDMGAVMCYLLMFVPFVMIAYMAIMSVAELFRQRPCPIEQIGKGLMGLIWIVFPLFVMAAMTMLVPSIVMAFLLIIWVYDTFAYLGGSFYGKHKMCEKISPKKTWEGTLTGALMAVAAVLIIKNIPYWSCCYLTTGEWIVFALLVVVFGTLGDLLESLIKRRADLKDSGNIMPGHGGMLDRFDSILFAAIPAFFYILGIII